MTIDLEFQSFFAIAGGIASVIVALYGRAVAAENQILKGKIDDLKEQHEQDIKRIDAMHGEDIKRIDRENGDIWSEIKCQREALRMNSEAIVKLNASIDRLNEILPRLEASVGEKISKGDCDLIRKAAANGFNRRRDDIKVCTE